MISIITCSINENYLSKLIESINKTVSIPFEIIVINNNVEKLSLANAYNKAALSAKFENLVFVHEDVEFLNNSWANDIVDLLINLEIGIIGVAGSTYLPSMPSGWYLPDDSLNKIFIIQGYKYQEKETIEFNQGIDLTPVYLLDGVFLAMRKNVFDEFLFNEKLDGFHAYDIDLCQRVSVKYTNLFTNRVKILHYSEGKNDKSYLDNLLKYKIQFKNFKYGKRNFYIEFKLLTNLYNGDFHNVNLRWFYSKNEIILKIKPFFRIKYLGCKNFFKFLFLLINDK